MKQSSITLEVLGSLLQKEHRLSSVNVLHVATDETKKLTVTVKEQRTIHFEQIYSQFYL